MRTLHNGRWMVTTRGAARALKPVVTILIAACSDGSTLAAQHVGLTATYVTESVAATLTPEGRFVLPIAAVSPPAEVSEAQAKAIAKRFVKAFPHSALGDRTAGHSASIRPDALEPCDRALYASNPYAAINGGNLSEVTMRTFGPHWVVPMCGPSRQLEVLVAFSALATELATAVETSAPVLPWERSYVTSYRAPRTAAAAMYSPEAVALYAFTKTGRRVSSVPDLIMTPMPKSSVLVRWRLDLEKPVSVKGSRSGVSRRRASLFIGFEETFKEFGMLDANPQGEPPLVSWMDPVTKAPFTVVLVPKAPVGVEIVTRGNQ